MNNIFNIKRFSTYFMYDLRNAKNNYGLSMVVVGLVPVIMFAFYQIIAWMSSANNYVLGSPVRVMSFLIACYIVLLSSPVKLYGRITERRYGSDWLMIPASTFEKWLSMMLITAIVIPVVMTVFLMASDTVLSLLFPYAYGETIFSILDGVNIFDIECGPQLSINLGYPLIVSWICNALIFTLGAIFFKRAKIAKTILACMAIGVVSSSVFFSFINADSFELFIDEVEISGDPGRAVSIINNWVNITMILELVVLSVAIFFRLRTIKH